MSYTAKDLIREQREFSEGRFGSKEVRGPEGSLKHFLTELKEVAANVGDIEEKADLLIIWLDAMWRDGEDPEEALDEIQDITEEEVDVILGDLLVYGAYHVAEKAIEDGTWHTKLAILYSMLCDFSEHEPAEILEAARIKMEKNRNRKWAEAKPGEPIFHIKEENESE